MSRGRHREKRRETERNRDEKKRKKKTPYKTSPLIFHLLARFSVYDCISFVCFDIRIAHKGSGGSETLSRERMVWNGKRRNVLASEGSK